MLPSPRAVVRALSLVLLAALAAALLGSPATAQVQAAEDDLLGMDVSGWQPTVDWPTAWADGARFAYVKATEGTTYRNPTWASHTIGARGVGMRVGAYHFARPDRSEPVPQADFFVDNGGHWTADGMTLPPVADVEDNPVAGGDRCYDRTPSELVAWVRAFVDRVYARTGRHPVIYTSTRWWRACTGDAPDFAATSPLWIARWASTVGPLPAGWTSHAIWQFNDDRGIFPGDSNRLNGGEDALRELALRQDSPQLELVLEHDGGAEPLVPGDELELRITGRNAGRGAAADVGVRTQLPAGLDYVPGSLRTVAGAGAPAGTPSDRAGDDRGEYREDTREAVFRIGQAAAHDRGGRVRYGVPFELRLRVRVTPGFVADGGEPYALTATARAGWDAPLRADGLETAASVTATVRPPAVEPEPVDPEPVDPEDPDGPGGPGGPGGPNGPGDPDGPGGPDTPVDPGPGKPGDGGVPPGVDPDPRPDAPALPPGVPNPILPSTVAAPGLRAPGAPAARPRVAARPRIMSTVLVLQRRRSGAAVGVVRTRCAGAPCVGTVTVARTAAAKRGGRPTRDVLARTRVRLRSGANGRLRVVVAPSRVAELRRGGRVRVAVRLREGTTAERTLRVRWSR